MNKKILGFLMFTVGAAIGSAVTWKLVKSRYEQFAQEEIDSVKHEYASLMKSMKEKLNENVKESSKDMDNSTNDDEYYPDDDERDFTPHEKDMVEYYKITSKYRQVEDEENDEKGGSGDVDEEDDFSYINGPYVISADEFNSSPPGYNAQPLDYFADGILADSWGVKLDIDETIGEESLNHFGEEQDDIIYVRNERNEIDYEVARDPRTYEESLRSNSSPYYGQ